MLTFKLFANRLTVYYFGILLDDGNLKINEFVQEDVGLNFTVCLPFAANNEPQHRFVVLGREKRFKVPN